jgi:glyoxylase-like metal-dependent hydrolase (beta-lactamase superfamily II)
VTDGLRQLADGLWSVGQRKGGRVHAFLCADGEELTLVDTLYDTDGHRILEVMERLGRRPEELRHIVLSHAHRSHLGGLAALKAATGATVYAHGWESDIIAGERKAQPVSLVPGRPLRAYIPLQLGLALGLGKHPPCPVDELVAGGDRVGPLEIVDATGHSPGHLAFHWRDRDALIAGDAVATWPSFMPGWPAFNLNERRHRASLRRLAELEPTILGVGHGNAVPSGARERLRDLVDALAV